MSSSEKEEDFWYNDDTEVLAKAMLKAKEAFNKYINDELGLEGAYFSLNLEGVVFYSDFENVKSRLKMDFIEGH